MNCDTYLGDKMGDRRVKASQSQLCWGLFAPCKSSALTRLHILSRPVRGVVSFAIRVCVCCWTSNRLDAD